MRPHLLVRRLFVEYLENRSVLAGNVLAQMVDSTLFISGDEFDNNVAVVSTGGDSVTVQGFQTAINGDTVTTTFSGVARIEIVGGDGDDLIQAVLGSAATIGEIRIDTEAGRDAVSLFTSSGADVIIDTGDGADVVGVQSYSGYGGGADLQIATGDGADLVFLDLGYHTEGAIRVDTGNGNDAVEVLFQVNESGGSLSISMGNGNDTVSLHTLGRLTDMDLTVDGGNGLDVLLGNPASFTGELDILSFEK
jgi:hypothetical protein